MKQGLTLIPRPDLRKDSIDFESVWVEIENRNDKNYLPCCAYRHPSTSSAIFSEYLQEVLSNPVCLINKYLSLEISISTF